jgi:hypothetical protein
MMVPGEPPIGGDCHWGFRVHDASGRYHSNLIWLNPEYAGDVSQEWVRRAVEASNG